MASLQATRLKKGMLINVEGNLFRVLDVMHVIEQGDHVAEVEDDAAGHKPRRLRSVRIRLYSAVRFQTRFDISVSCTAFIP